jgi:hypothetical protein
MGRLANPPPEERPLSWCHGGTGQGAVGVSESSDRRPAEAGTGNGEKGKSMRVLKLCAMFGLLVALSAPAWGLNFNYSYNGPVTLKFYSWDVGTLYGQNPGGGGAAVPADTLVDGIGALDALNQLKPASLWPTIPSGPYDGNSEDSWGLFTIDKILAKNPPPGQGSVLWSNDAANPFELVGMFYGLVDHALYYDSSTGAQEIISCGYYFDIYEQPRGTLFNSVSVEPVAGPSDRFDFDKYVGVGYSDNLGTTIGTKILSGVSTTGITPINTAGYTNGLPAEHYVSFIPGQEGDADFYIDLTGGTLHDNWEVDPYYFPTSQDGDLQLHADLDAAGQYGFNVTNQDPVEGYVVPEPTTMFVAFLGVGALASYVRRRRS